MNTADDVEYVTMMVLYSLYMLDLNDEELLLSYEKWWGQREFMMLYGDCPEMVADHFVSGMLIALYRVEVAPESMFYTNTYRNRFAKDCHDLVCYEKSLQILEIGVLVP